MSSFQKHFSHLYIEESVLDEPLTELVLKKFPKATRITLKNYRDVFNRPNQNFQLQKQSKKLILARKRDHLLYPGNDKVQDFGYRNFSYNTLLLNCLYNCAYCYLQGMFQSANMVAFVNESDFFASTRKAIAQRSDKASPLYLAISYDTDLLAFENVIPFCQRWIEFSRQENDLKIEIRTKSANASAIAALTPHPNAIFAWTLSPQCVIDAYEQDTPSLERRLVAIEKTINAGWPIRLCFDPVLRIANWQSIYTDFIETVFKRIHPETIQDVSLGLFRINTDYFSKLKKNRPDTDLIYQHYHRENNVLSLLPEQREEMIAALTDTLCRYFPRTQLGIWT